MRDKLFFWVVRGLVRIFYGYYPCKVQIFRELTPAELAEREKAARELAAHVVADTAALRRRFRMGVVDDTLTELPPITTAPIRGDN